MIKSRSSQGHIEMILSFVIFMGFIAAIFIFFNPTRQETLSYSSLDAVQEKVLANISLNYQYISLILDSTPNSCFSVENRPGINSKFIVQDIGQNSLNSTKIGPNIFMKNSGKFYKIYFSDAFNQYNLSSTGSCITLPNNYSYGVLVNESRILFESIELFEEAYLRDYSLLKENLGLQNDFDFSVYYFNRTLIMNESLSVHKIKMSNMLSRDVPLKAINKNAKEVNLIFNIRIW